MEKSNVIPVIKKGDEELLVNYCPNLLPFTTDKTFERFLLNQIYEIFNRNKSFSKGQSGLNLGDSYINQLLAISH